MQRQAAGKMLLIAGLGLVFGVFGVDKFLSPFVWIGWIPTGMEGLLGLSRGVWLRVIGFAELLMAILVIIPLQRVRQTGATLMALHLVAILTQTGWSDIGIRDTGLLLSALALLFLL